VAPEPAVIHLNSSVASKAVSEFSKLVTGFDEPSGFVRFADVENELVGMSTSPTEGCVTCGDVLGQGRVSVEDVPIEEDGESVGDDEDGVVSA